MTKGRPVIAVNFARTDFRLLARIRAGLVAVTVLLFLLLGAQVLRLQSVRAQYMAEESQAKALSASEQKLRPVLEERERLLHTLGDMKPLLDARRFSWTSVLTGIERVFPVGMALTDVKFDRKDRTLTLQGIARSPDALSGLMIGLERSRQFKSPLLKHQSMEKGILSFDVAVRYQEESAFDTSSGPGRNQGQ